MHILVLKWLVFSGRMVVEVEPNGRLNWFDVKNGFHRTIHPINEQWVKRGRGGEGKKNYHIYE